MAYTMTRAALLVSFVVRAVGDIDPWCDAHGFAPEDQYRAVSTLLSSWSHEQRVKRLSESLTRSRGPSLGEVAAAYARADFAPEPRFEALRYSHLPTSKTVALLITGELRTLPTPVMQRFFDHVGRAVVSAGFQYRWFAAVDVCSKSKPCGTTHEASARDVRSLLETALGAAPEDVAVTGEPRCEKSCDGHAALARLDVTREVLACNGPAAEVWAMEQHRASAIHFQFAKRALGLDLVQHNWPGLQCVMDDDDRWEWGADASTMACVAGDSWTCLNTNFTRIEAAVCTSARSTATRRSRSTRSAAWSATAISPCASGRRSSTSRCCATGSARRSARRARGPRAGARAHDRDQTIRPSTTARTSRTACRSTLASPSSSRRRATSSKLFR